MNRKGLQGHLMKLCNSGSEAEEETRRDQPQHGSGFSRGGAVPKVGKVEKNGARRRVQG